MSFATLTISRSIGVTSSQAPAQSSAAAAPASSAAPAASSSAQAVQTSQAAAAPASSAAAATTQAAAASSSAAAPAAQSSNNNAASSSSRPASSSVAASSAAASSSAASSSAAASSTSTIPPSSSASSSRASSASASTTSAGIIGSSTQNSTGGSSTLPGSTIGAIAGGVVGGLLLIALAWTCWKRLKGRKDRVPPPPPREMAFNPTSNSRSRAVSGGMMEQGMGVGVHRENSFATLLHTSPSTQVSRQPSYYGSYPIATPSTLNGTPPDTSPEFYPVQDAAMVSSAMPPPAISSGTSTPGGHRGLSPIHGEDHESDLPPGIIAPIPRGARRISSMDRIRQGGERPPSPSGSSLQFPSPRPATGPYHQSVPEESITSGGEGGSMTPPSPPSRSSSSPMLSGGHGGGYPRPGSMSSLSSRGYLHVGPARGAPHQGRPVQLEMPRLLGSDGEGVGGYPTTPTSPLGQGMEWRGRNSGGMPQDYLPNPFPQSPPLAQGHRRMTSNQSINGYSNAAPSIRSVATYTAQPQNRNRMSGSGSFTAPPQN